MSADMGHDFETVAYQEVHQGPPYFFETKTARQCTKCGLFDNRPEYPIRPCEKSKSKSYIDCDGGGGKQ